MKRVTLADLTTATGCGKRTAIRLVREGKLPGFMDGTRYVCPPGEFEDWLAGKWEYRGTPSTPPRTRKRQPIQLQSLTKRKAA